MSAYNFDTDGSRNCLLLHRSRALPRCCSCHGRCHQYCCRRGCDAMKMSSLPRTASPSHESQAEPGIHLKVWSLKLPADYDAKPWKSSRAWNPCEGVTLHLLFIASYTPATSKCISCSYYFPHGQSNEIALRLPAVVPLLPCPGVPWEHH